MSTWNSDSRHSAHPMADKPGSIRGREESGALIGNSVDVAMGSLILGTGFDVAMASAGLCPVAKEELEPTPSETDLQASAFDPAAAGLDASATQCVAADHASTSIDPALLHVLLVTI